MYTTIPVGKLVQMRGKPKKKITFKTKVNNYYSKGTIQSRHSLSLNDKASI